MAQGDKPDFSVTYSPRDKSAGGTGNRKLPKLISGWRSKYGWNLAFPKGAVITLADGEVIECDAHWFNGKDWTEGAPKETPATVRTVNRPRPAEPPAGEGGEDDIPF